MAKNKIKAVLFDLDGVIVDTAKYHYLAWKLLADEMGIYFDEKINERFKGVSRKACIDILVQNEPLKYSKMQKEQFAMKKNDTYIKMLNDLTAESLLPNIQQFLTDLKSNNRKSAICSASQNAILILGKLGISNLFDTIVTGNDTKESKPNPEVFTTAANRMKVHYENCLVIEDSQAGIDAANACGMQSIAIGDKRDLKDSTIVISSSKEMIWNDLINILEN